MDYILLVFVFVYDEGLVKKLWEVSERFMGIFEERKIIFGSKIFNDCVIDRLNCKIDIMSEFEIKFVKCRCVE